METKRRQKKSTHKKVTATPARKKFGKKVYTVSACQLDKTEAKKKAESIRSGGKLARLLKNKTGKYCVYTAGSTTGIGKKRRTIRRRTK